MNEHTRVWWRATCLSVLLLRATSAAAHGGPPSALGIVASDRDGPKLVLLNEGLALSHAGEWSYLCPRLWGDPDTASGKLPLALSADGIASYIIGADDVYIARDGQLMPQGRPTLSNAAVIALAALDGGLFGLRLGDAGSAVVRIDAPDETELFASEDYWSAMAGAAGRLHLARLLEQPELALVTLDGRGEVIEEFRAPLAAMPAQLKLRPTAQTLFAVTFDGDTYALVTLAAGRTDTLLQSAGPIEGPQASSDGTLWIALDGELMRATGGGFESVGEARRITCLSQSGSRPIACAGSELYPLEDHGLGERLFQLDGLLAPDPRLVPEAAARECEYQWLLFRNDLERSGLAPRDRPANEMPAADAGGAQQPVADAAAAPMAARRSDAGCSAAIAGVDPRWAWASVVAPAALLLRRRRRRSSAPAA